MSIQHVTVRIDDCVSFIARLRGKRLHDDFDAIRPSGNRLFLLTPERHDYPTRSATVIQAP